MLHKGKCTGTINVFLVPSVTVRIKVFLRINKIEWRSQCGDEATRRILQLENHFVFASLLDLVHHPVKGFTRTGDAFRWKNQFAVGGHDIIGRQGCSIVELYVLTNFERISLSAIRHFPIFTNVALEIAGRLRVVRIDPD